MATYPTDQYPDTDDLARLIDATGVTDTEGYRFSLLCLDAKIDGAVEQWETRTGWVPYLAARDPQGSILETTRTFDPPSGPVLKLRGGLLSCSSVTVYGESYVVGQDCYLQPSDAPAKNKPSTEIRFRRRIGSCLPQCVEVTGVWGRTLTLDGTAREAIVAKAASLCVPEIALGIGGGHYKIDNIQYAGSDSSPLSAEQAMWDRVFDTSAKAKKRITV